MAFFNTSFRQLMRYVGLWGLIDKRYKENRVARSAILNGARLEGGCIICSDTVLVGAITVGKCSLLGHSNFLVGGKVSVGAYCQFGPNVAIYALNHPTETLSTYTGPALVQGKLREQMDLGQVRVGNDVWIGHGAIILPNVTIGDGAVVGAGSVVTKEVLPYSIVAGNPAKMIRKRFAETTIDQLLLAKWWELPSQVLNENIDIFVDQINEEKTAKLLQLKKQMVPKG